MEDEMTVNIHSLPEEALLHVFSFLSPTVLRDSISRVCVQWRELHRHPSLYRVLNLTDDQSTEDVLRWVGYARCIASLSITRLDCDTILASLPNTRYLRSLNLDMFNKHEFDTDDDVVYLDESIFLNVIRSSPDLRILKLMECVICSLVFDESMRPTLSNLRVLYLIKVTCSLTSDMLEIVSNCPHLEELKICECFYETVKDTSIVLNDAEMKSLCDRLQSTLRMLHLDCGQWTRQGLSSLMRCNHLQDLGIFYAQDLTSECLLVFGCIPDLRKLVIAHCGQPSEDVWIRLVTSPKLKKLEVLVLILCNCNSRVAEAIDKNLSHLTNLTLPRQAQYPSRPIRDYSVWVSNAELKMLALESQEPFIDSSSDEEE